MAANCRLEPEPDAALHAPHRTDDERRSGARAKRSDVRRRIAAAPWPCWHEYLGDFFDHPGWSGARSGALSPGCCHLVGITLARSSAHKM